MCGDTTTTPHHDGGVYDDAVLLPPDDEASGPPLLLGTAVVDSPTTKAIGPLHELLALQKIENVGLGPGGATAIMPAELSGRVDGKIKNELERILFNFV